MYIHQSMRIRPLSQSSYSSGDQSSICQSVMQLAMKEQRLQFMLNWDPELNRGSVPMKSTGSRITSVSSLQVSRDATLVFSVCRRTLPPAVIVPLSLARLPNRGCCKADHCVDVGRASSQTTFTKKILAGARFCERAGSANAPDFLLASCIDTSQDFHKSQTTDKQGTVRLTHRQIDSLTNIKWLPDEPTRPPSLIKSSSVRNAYPRGASVGFYRLPHGNLIHRHDSQIRLIRLVPKNNQLVSVDRYSGQLSLLASSPVPPIHACTYPSIDQSIYPHIDQSVCPSIYSTTHKVILISSRQLVAIKC